MRNKKPFGQRSHYQDSNGFKHSHGGRENYPSSSWGRASEFGRNTEFRESDTYERPERQERQKFEPPTRNEFRSRSSEPYVGGEFSSSQYGIGGKYHGDWISHESRGYGLSAFGFRGKGPKGYERSDERIFEDVCEALFHSPIVDASDIEVQVKEGNVYLRGTVGDRHDKREAEICIEHIGGVVDVMNELQIRNMSHPSH